MTYCELLERVLSCDCDRCDSSCPYDNYGSPYNTDGCVAQCEKEIERLRAVMKKLDEMNLEVTG